MFYVRLRSEDSPSPISAGLFTKNKTFTHSKYPLDCFQLILGIKGTSYIKEGNYNLKVAAGDILVLTPNKAQLEFITTDTVLEYLWICFECSNFDELDELEAINYLNILNIHGNEEFANNILIPILGHYENISRITVIIQQLIYTLSKKYYTKKICDHLLMTLLYEITQQNISLITQNIDENEEDNRFSRILEWIRMNSNTNITLDDISKEFNYNKNYLLRIFKQKTGVTIGDYIKDLRIAQAKQLLCNTDYSIKEISYNIGYNDERYFMKLFKNFEHLTPTEFRNAYFRSMLIK